MEDMDMQKRDLELVPSGVQAKLPVNGKATSFFNTEIFA